MESPMNFRDTQTIKKKQFMELGQPTFTLDFTGNSGKLENHWLKISLVSQTVLFVFGR